MASQDQAPSEERPAVPAAGGLLKLRLTRTNDNWSLSPNKNPLKLCLKLNKPADKEVSETENTSNTSDLPIQPETVSDLNDLGNDPSDIDESTDNEDVDDPHDVDYACPSVEAVNEEVEEEDEEEEESEESDDGDEYKPPPCHRRRLRSLVATIPKIKIKPISPADCSRDSPRLYQVSPAHACNGSDEEVMPRRVLRERKEKTETPNRRSPRCLEHSNAEISAQVESELKLPPVVSRCGRSPRRKSEGKSPRTLNHPALETAPVPSKDHAETKPTQTEYSEPRVPPLKLSTLPVFQNKEDLLKKADNEQMQMKQVPAVSGRKEWHSQQTSRSNASKGPDPPIKADPDEKGSDLSVLTACPTQQIDSSPENPIQPSPKDSGIDVSSPPRRDEEPIHMEFSPNTGDPKRHDVHLGPEPVSTEATIMGTTVKSRYLAAKQVPDSDSELITSGSDQHDSAVEDDASHVIPVNGDCNASEKAMFYNGHKPPTGNHTKASAALPVSDSVVITNSASTTLSSTVVTRVPGLNTNGHYTVNLVKDTKLKISASGPKNIINSWSKPEPWNSANLSLTSTVVTPSTQSSMVSDINSSQYGCTVVSETVSQTVTPLSYRIHMPSQEVPTEGKHPHRKFSWPTASDPITSPLASDPFAFTETSDAFGKEGVSSVANPKRKRPLNSLDLDKARKLFHPNAAKKPISPTKRHSSASGASAIEKESALKVKCPKLGDFEPRVIKPEIDTPEPVVSAKSPRAIFSGKLQKKPDCKPSGLSAVRKHLMEVGATIGRKTKPPSPKPPPSSPSKSICSLAAAIGCPPKLTNSSLTDPVKEPTRTVPQVSSQNTTGSKGCAQPPVDQIGGKNFDYPFKSKGIPSVKSAVHSPPKSKVARTGDTAATDVVSMKKYAASSMENKNCTSVPTSPRMKSLKFANLDAKNGNPDLDVPVLITGLKSDNYCKKSPTAKNASVPTIGTGISKKSPIAKKLPYSVDLPFKRTDNKKTVELLPLKKENGLVKTGKPAGSKVEGLTKLFVSDELPVKYAMTLDVSEDRSVSPASSDGTPCLSAHPETHDKQNATECEKVPVEPMGYKQKLLGTVYRTPGGSSKSPSRSPIKKRFRGQGGSLFNPDASHASTGSLSPPNITANSPLPPTPGSDLCGTPKLSDSTESFDAPPELFAEPKDLNSSGNIKTESNESRLKKSLWPDPSSSPDCSMIDPFTGLSKPSHEDSRPSDDQVNSLDRSALTPTPPPPSAFLNEFAKFLKQSQRQNVILPQKTTKPYKPDSPDSVPSPLATDFKSISDPGEEIKKIGLATFTFSNSHSSTDCTTKLKSTSHAYVRASQEGKMDNLSLTEFTKSLRDDRDSTHLPGKCSERRSSASSFDLPVLSSGHETPRPSSRAFTPSDMEQSPDLQSVMSFDSDSQYKHKSTGEQQQDFDYMCDLCVNSDIDDFEQQGKVTCSGFNTSLFIEDQEKVVFLRHKVVELFHVLFPMLQYPACFSVDTPQVEVLMDQVISVIRDEDVHSPITVQKNDDDLMDVDVVVCKSPRHCLSNIQRKVVRILEALLPELELENNFDCHTDKVEDLLVEVIAINRKQCDTKCNSEKLTTSQKTSEIQSTRTADYNYYKSNEEDVDLCDEHSGHTDSSDCEGVTL